MFTNSSFSIPLVISRTSFTNKEFVSSIFKILWHGIKWKLTLEIFTTSSTWSIDFVSKRFLVHKFCLRDGQTDDFIDCLLLLKTIAGLTFKLVPYEEVYKNIGSHITCFLDDTLNPVLSVYCNSLTILHLSSQRFIKCSKSIFFGSLFVKFHNSSSFRVVFIIMFISWWLSLLSFFLLRSFLLYTLDLFELL